MKTNLLKLIYLIDLEYYKKWGKQATDFEYFFYKKGPWTAQFDRALTELEGFEIKSLTKEKLDKKEEYCIFCKGPKPRFQPSLPPDLKEIVDSILFLFERIPQKDLLQYVYSTEPMRSVKFGDKIDFSAIYPQPQIDPQIERIVSEANKEYESTNFPKILSSWEKESPLETSHDKSVCYCILGFSSLPSMGGYLTIKPKFRAKKEISLSDEILIDRENA